MHLLAAKKLTDTTRDLKWAIFCVSFVICLWTPWFSVRVSFTSSRVFFNSRKMLANTMGSSSSILSTDWTADARCTWSEAKKSTRQVAWDRMVFYCWSSRLTRDQMVDDCHDDWLCVPNDQCWRIVWMENLNDIRKRSSTWVACSSQATATYRRVTDLEKTNGGWMCFYVDTEQLKRETRVSLNWRSPMNHLRVEYVIAGACIVCPTRSDSSSLASSMPSSSSFPSMNGGRDAFSTKETERCYLLLNHSLCSIPPDRSLWFLVISDNWSFGVYIHWRRSVVYLIWSPSLVCHCSVSEDHRFPFASRSSAG